jgi:hypothetical protein
MDLVRLLLQARRAGSPPRHTNASIRAFSLQHEDTRAVALYMAATIGEGIIIAIVVYSLGLLQEKS